MSEPIRRRRKPKSEGDGDGQEAAGNGRALNARQAAFARLVSSYKYECKKLFKKLLERQQKWREEVQEAEQKKKCTTPPNEQVALKPEVNERFALPWKTLERDILKRCFMAFGVGRWREVHASMRATCRSFSHGVGDVEDACWDLMGELKQYASEDDARFLEQMLDQVRDRLPIVTPGAAWPKLEAGVKNYVKRLRLLEDFSMLMRRLPNPSVQAAFLEALAVIAPVHLPTQWWTGECDLALLWGVFKYGYQNYEAVKQDPEHHRVFMEAWQSHQNRMGTTTASEPPSSHDPHPHHPGDANVMAQGVSGQTVRAEECRASSVDPLHPEARGPPGYHGPDGGGLAGGVEDHDDEEEEGGGLGEEDLEEVPGWPTSDVLTRRVKRITESLYKVVAAVDVELQAEGASPAPPDHPLASINAPIDGAPGIDELARYEAANVMWSKKDRVEFVKALTNHGVMMIPGSDSPDWTRFKELVGGNLSRKPNVAIEKVYREVLSEMEGILAATSGKVMRKNTHQAGCQCIVCNNRRKGEMRRAAMKAALAPEGEAEGEGEGEGEEDGGEETADEMRGGDDEEEETEDEEPEATRGAVDNTGLVEDQEDGSEGEGDAGDDAQGEGEAVEPSTIPNKLEVKKRRRRGTITKVLTSLTAVRLRDRLELMNTLRSGFERLRPEWCEQLSLVNRTGDLPYWWAPEHDMQLIAGVLKSGLGQWEDVLNRPESTFRKDAARAARQLSIKSGGDGGEIQPSIEHADGTISEGNIMGVDRLESMDTCSKDMKGLEGGGAARVLKSLGPHGGSAAVNGFAGKEDDDSEATEEDQGHEEEKGGPPLLGHSPARFPDNRTLMKRCRQIANTMRRLLRKPKYCLPTKQLKKAGQQTPHQQRLRRAGDRNTPEVAGSSREPTPIHQVHVGHQDDENPRRVGHEQIHTARVVPLHSYSIGAGSASNHHRMHHPLKTENRAHEHQVEPVEEHGMDEGDDLMTGHRQGSRVQSQRRAPEYDPIGDLAPREHHHRDEWGPDTKQAEGVDQPARGPDPPGHIIHQRPMSTLQRPAHLRPSDSLEPAQAGQHDLPTYPGCEEESEAMLGEELDEQVGVPMGGKLKNKRRLKSGDKGPDSAPKRRKGKGVQGVEDGLGPPRSPVHGEHLVRSTSMASSLGDSPPAPGNAPAGKRSRRSKLPVCPRDSQGRPVLPFRIGPEMILMDLGELVPNNERFNTDKYIIPRGYKLLKGFHSMVDPKASTTYLCEVLQTGDRPMFQVTPTDAPEKVILHPGPTGCWTAVQRAVDVVKGVKRERCTLNGFKMFGLAHPAIVPLIQEMAQAAPVRSGAGSAEASARPAEVNGKSDATSESGLETGASLGGKQSKAGIPPGVSGQEFGAESPRRPRLIKSRYRSTSPEHENELFDYSGGIPKHDLQHAMRGRVKEEVHQYHHAPRGRVEEEVHEYQHALRARVKEEVLEYQHALRGQEREEVPDKVVPDDSKRKHRTKSLEARVVPAGQSQVEVPCGEPIAQPPLPVPQGCISAGDLLNRMLQEAVERRLPLDLRTIQMLVEMQARGQHLSVVDNGVPLGRPQVGTQEKGHAGQALGVNMAAGEGQPVHMEGLGSERVVVDSSRVRELSRNERLAQPGVRNVDDLTRRVKEEYRVVPSRERYESEPFNGQYLRSVPGSVDLGRSVVTEEVKQRGLQAYDGHGRVAYGEDVEDNSPRLWAANRDRWAHESSGPVQYSRMAVDQAGARTLLPVPGEQVLDRDAGATRDLAKQPSRRGSMEEAWYPHPVDMTGRQVAPYRTISDLKKDGNHRHIGVDDPGPARPTIVHVHHHANEAPSVRKVDPYPLEGVRVDASSYMPTSVPPGYGLVTHVPTNSSPLLVQLHQLPSVGIRPPSPDRSASLQRQGCPDVSHTQRTEATWEKAADRQARVVRMASNIYHSNAPEVSERTSDDLDRDRGTMKQEVLHHSVRSTKWQEDEGDRRGQVGGKGQQRKGLDVQDDAVTTHSIPPASKLVNPSSEDEKPSSTSTPQEELPAKKRRLMTRMDDPALANTLFQAVAAGQLPPSCLSGLNIHPGGGHLAFLRDLQGTDRPTLVPVASAHIPNLVPVALREAPVWAQGGVQDRADGSRAPHAGFPPGSRGLEVLGPQVPERGRASGKDEDDIGKEGGDRMKPGGVVMDPIRSGQHKSRSAGGQGVQQVEGQSRPAVDVMDRPRLAIPEAPMVMMEGQHAQLPDHVREILDAGGTVQFLMPTTTRDHKPQLASLGHHPQMGHHLGVPQDMAVGSLQGYLTGGQVASRPMPVPHTQMFAGFHGVQGRGYPEKMPVPQWVGFPPALVASVHAATRGEQQQGAEEKTSPPGS